MQKLHLFSLLLGLSLGLFCPDQALTAQGTIRLGINNSRPSVDVKAYLPFVAYIEEQLGIEVSFRTAETTEAMVKKIQNHEVDLFMDSPYEVVRIASRTGSRLVLRQWKSGVAEYQTAIVVQKDAVAASLQDLKGKTLALEEVQSTTSYYLPLYLIREAGVPVVQLDSITTPVPAGQVGYILVGHEPMIRKLVREGVIFSGGTKLSTVKDDKQLKILATSIAVPRSIVAFSPNFTGPIADKLLTVMLDMDQSPQGAKALAALHETKKFDKFPQGGEAILKELLPLFEKY